MYARLLTFIIMMVFFAKPVLSIDSFNKEKAIPLSIRSFYENYNLVSIFTTKVEREAIAKYVVLNQQEQRKVQLPSYLKNIRKIALLVRSQVYDIDSEINILDSCPSKAKRLKVIRQYESEDKSIIVLTEEECVPEAKFLLLYEGNILTPEHSIPFNNGIAIRVKVYGLNEKDRNQLLAQYKRFTGDYQRIHPIENVLKIARGELIKEEVHYWSNIDNLWMRTKVKALLLGEKSF